MTTLKTNFLAFSILPHGHVFNQKIILICFNL